MRPVCRFKAQLKLKPIKSEAVQNDPQPLSGHMPVCLSVYSCSSRPALSLIYLCYHIQVFRFRSRGPWVDAWHSFIYPFLPLHNKYKCSHSFHSFFNLLDPQSLSVHSLTLSLSTNDFQLVRCQNLPSSYE